MKSYGKVRLEPQATAESFAALIAALNLKPPVVIKPNWGTVECFTEAEILDWALAAIPGDKLVIESHGWARNEETLRHQASPGLTKANLRRGDRWFLGYTGIDRVLEKHHVAYLNLTEEIWAGRAADPALIQKTVETHFPPVEQKDLYAKVPARLYEMRGGSLLSLAKHKIVFYPLGVSFSIKNLFGLVPGPSRGKYHGKDNVLLDQSIVDINKIYRSLFSLKGVVEAVQSFGRLETDEERTRVYPGRGLAMASEDTVSLDAFAAVIGGRMPDSVGHLRLAAQTFGSWDMETCEEAMQSAIKVLEY
jgi:uncharacterized protein (DUF362 family)